MLNKQSAVVEATLRELFFKNKLEKFHDKTVLVLLFHHLTGLHRHVHELRELHDNNMRVRICPDEQLLDYFSVTEIAGHTGIDDWITLKEAEVVKEQFDHIYMPNLSFSTVSELVNFNDARPSIRILLWALMRGKNVSANSFGADPYHPVWQESGLHHGSALLKREMKSKLDQLRGFGIKLIEDKEDLLGHILESSQEKRNQVITADTIINYAKEGKHSIEVNEKTIITPLAQDLARENELEIVRKVR